MSESTVRRILDTPEIGPNGFDSGDALALIGKRESEAMNLLLAATREHHELQKRIRECRKTIDQLEGAIGFARSIRADPALDQAAKE